MTINQDNDKGRGKLSHILYLFLSNYFLPEYLLESLKCLLFPKKILVFHLLLMPYIIIFFKIEIFHSNFLSKLLMTSHPFWFPFDVNEDELLRLLQYQSRISYKYGATRNPQRQFGYIFYNPFTRCLKCISDSQSQTKDLKNTFRLLRQFLEESTFIFNFFSPISRCH